MIQLKKQMGHCSRCHRHSRCHRFQDYWAHFPRYGFPWREDCHFDAAEIDDHFHHSH